MCPPKGAPIGHQPLPVLLTPVLSPVANKSQPWIKVLKKASGHGGGDSDEKGRGGEGHKRTEKNHPMGNDPNWAVGLVCSPCWLNTCCIDSVYTEKCQRNTPCDSFLDLDFGGWDSIRKGRRKSPFQICVLVTPNWIISDGVGILCCYMIFKPVTREIFSDPVSTFVTLLIAMIFHNCSIWSFLP